jgi:hypothetical protein
MNYSTALLTTVTLASFAFPSIAAAQSAKDIVGTWTLVAAETTMPDGKKTPSFGTKPTGMLVFTEDGRFIYLYTRGDLPKVASNSRATTTPQEGAEISQGSIATYGTYTVADKTLKVKVDHSTFANWNGAEQTRTIVITGDEMKWSNPAGSAGGVAELVLKRAPKATN